MDKILREAVYKYLENNNYHRRFLDRRTVLKSPDLFSIMETDRNLWVVSYREYSPTYDEYENRSFLVQYKERHDVFIVSEIMATETYSLSELEN